MALMVLSTEIKPTKASGAVMRRGMPPEVLGGVGGWAGFGSTLTYKSASLMPPLALGVIWWRTLCGVNLVLGHSCTVCGRKGVEEGSAASPEAVLEQRRQPRNSMTVRGELRPGRSDEGVFFLLGCKIRRFAGR